MEYKLNTVLGAPGRTKPVSREEDSWYQTCHLLEEDVDTVNFDIQREDEWETLNKQIEKEEY